MMTIFLLAGLVGGRAADAATSPTATGQPVVSPTGDSKTATLRVEKMMCQSCASRIKETLAKTDGVQTVEASSAEKKVTVRFDPAKTDIPKLIAALKVAGFDAEAVTS
jgi:copper chaperone CopZ